MGLFVKKQDIGISAPLYSLGARRSLIIVGLGNIGKQYAQTRHNVGFSLIDAFAESQGFPAWSDKKDLHCQVTVATLGDTQVILVKPTTFMNNSGQAVQAVQHFYKLTNEQLLVIHDELALNFGQLRVRKGGGNAGNNGVKSVIAYCGENFTRMRVGIANSELDKIDQADFVLAKFNSNELEVMPKIAREVLALLSEYLASGSLDHETRSVDV